SSSNRRGDPERLGRGVALTATGRVRSRISRTVDPLLAVPPVVLTQWILLLNLFDALPNIVVFYPFPWPPAINRRGGRCSLRPGSRSGADGSPPAHNASG